MFTNRTMKIMTAAKGIVINDQQIDPEENYNVPNTSQVIYITTTNELQDTNNNNSHEFLDSPKINAIESSDDTQYRHDVANEIIIPLDDLHEPDDVQTTTHDGNACESESGPIVEVSTSRALRNRNIVTNYSESEDDDDSVEDPSYSCDLEAITRQPFHVVADSNNDSNEEDENLCEYKGRPKKGRKRKFEDQDRSQKKINKNSNKPYYNYKGVKVDSKPFNDFQCSCPQKCTERVSVEKRKQEFDRFWSLQSYDSQTTFIAASVSEYPKNRLYGRNPTKRKFSRKYKIDDQVVCRNTFVKTLGVSTSRINTALGKFHGRMPLPDQRGITGGSNKLSDVRVQNVIDQVNKIPRYISHYSRNKTEARFLPPGTTIQKMYDMYCSEQNDPVSIASYKRIFYTKFNLRMKPIKKDTCNTCDSLKAQIDNERILEIKEDLKRRHNEHLQLAEEAQTMPRQDFERARQYEEIECLTFDLEKTLPLPRIPTNIVFYKRQLWVYNAGIHSAKEERGYCYVWVEGKAGRGAQEVGSCLLKHIQSRLPPTVKHLLLWSDACGGQNRNIKLTLLLKYILHNTPSLESITMNFLISGHSFLPNDSDFSDIESALKNQQRLYTPDDYISIMKTCRKKQPLVVTKMDSVDFFGVEKIEKNIVNRKQTETSEKINWLHVRSIKLEKDEPFYISLKQHNFSNPYQKVNIKKNIRGRPNTADSVFDLVPLWPDGKPIAELKLKNINEMLHLIPADALSFYTNLKSDKTIVEDVDGFDVAHLDFDTEGE